MSKLVKLPFRYEVIRISGRRTLSIEVHPDQRIIVRAPVDCEDAVIAARLQRRSRWVLKKRHEFERYKPKTPMRQYIGGETHLYLGRQYRLKLSRGQTESVKLVGGYLVVTTRNGKRASIQRALEVWYRHKARDLFERILTEALGRFRTESRPRLVIRRMRTRWGSLSPTGIMTLNLDLIRAPRACIEYVVMHELCHLKHPAHDAAFFRRLSRLMPDWDRHKHRLEVSLL